MAARPALSIKAPPIDVEIGTEFSLSTTPLPEAALELPTNLQGCVRRVLAADRKGGDALLEKAAALADARAAAQHGEWGIVLIAIKVHERASRRLLAIHERAQRDPAFADAVRSGWLTFSVAALAAQADDALLDKLLTQDAPPTRAEIEIITGKTDTGVRNDPPIEQPKISERVPIIHITDPDLFARAEESYSAGESHLGKGRMRRPFVYAMKHWISVGGNYNSKGEDLQECVRVMLAGESYALGEQYSWFKAGAYTGDQALFAGQTYELTGQWLIVHRARVTTEPPAPDPLALPPALAGWRWSTNAKTGHHFLMHPQGGHIFTTRHYPEPQDAIREAQRWVLSQPKAKLESEEPSTNNRLPTTNPDFAAVVARFAALGYRLLLSADAPDHYRLFPPGRLVGIGNMQWHAVLSHLESAERQAIEEQESQRLAEHIEAQIALAAEPSAPAPDRQLPIVAYTTAMDLIGKLRGAVVAGARATAIERCRQLIALLETADD